MKTPDEARQTWCPWAIVPGRVTGKDSPEDPERTMGFCGQNRGYAMGRALENTYCLAYDCSQWVWVHNDKEAGETVGFCGRNTAMALKVFGR